VVSYLTAKPSRDVRRPNPRLGGSRLIVLRHTPSPAPSAWAPDTQALEARDHFLGEVFELTDVVDEGQGHAAEAGVMKAFDFGGYVVG
jgi:hypothetical protein